MKSSNYLALTASVALLWGGLTGCTENPLEDPGTEPSVEVTPVSADSRSATFTVNTTAITEIAYSAYAARRGVQPNLVFEHQLARFTFEIIPGSASADNIQVEALSLQSLLYDAGIGLRHD